MDNDEFSIIAAWQSVSLHRSRAGRLLAYVSDDRALITSHPFGENDQSIPNDTLQTNFYPRVTQLFLQSNSFAGYKVEICVRGLGGGCGASKAAVAVHPSSYGAPPASNYQPVATKEQASAGKLPAQVPQSSQPATGVKVPDMHVASISVPTIPVGSTSAPRATASQPNSNVLPPANSTPQPSTKTPQLPSIAPSTYSLKKTPLPAIKSSENDPSVPNKPPAAQSDTSVKQLPTDTSMKHNAANSTTVPNLSASSNAEKALISKVAQSAVADIVSSSIGKVVAAASIQKDKGSQSIKMKKESQEEEAPLDETIASLKKKVLEDEKLSKECALYVALQATRDIRGCKIVDLEAESLAFFGKNDEGKRVAFLVGESGCGKTCFLNFLERRLCEQLLHIVPLRVRTSVEAAVSSAFGTSSSSAVRSQHFAFLVDSPPLADDLSDLVHLFPKWPNSKFLVALPRPLISKPDSWPIELEAQPLFVSPLNRSRQEDLVQKYKAKQSLADLEVFAGSEIILQSPFFLMLAAQAALSSVTLLTRITVLDAAFKSFTTYKFFEDLARAMYEEDLVRTRELLSKSSKDNFRTLPFVPPDPFEIRAVYDYFVASAVLADTSSSALLGLQPLPDSVVRLLADRVATDSSLPPIFLRIVLESREDNSANAATAAANAISILARAHVPLSGKNLSGVRVSGADLSGAVLDGTNLTSADLSKTRMEDTFLANADVSNADLDDIDFGVLPFLQHSFTVRGLVWSPDGTSIYTASDDRSVHEWSLETHENVKDFRGHSAAVKSVDVCCTATASVQVASGSADCFAKVWDGNTGGEVASWEHPAPVNAVLFCPRHPDLLITACDDQKVRVYSVQSEHLMATSSVHPDSVWSLRATSDGEVLITTGADATARVLSLPTLQELRTFTKHTKGVTAVDVTIDSLYAVSGSLDKTIRVWKINTAEQVRCLQGHTRPVTAVRICHEKRVILSSSEGTAIRMWDFDSGDAILELHGHTAAVYGLDVRGNMLASGSSDWKARLWSLDGALVRAVGSSGTVRLMECPVFCIHTDGSLLLATAARNERSIGVWDVCTGAYLRTLLGHTDTVRALQVRGDVGVSASDDGLVMAWDVKTSGSTATLRGHRGAVWSVALSPTTPDVVVSGGTDMTVRVWSISGGKETLVIDAHTDWIHSVVYTPDGKYIATASKDHTAKLFDAATGGMVQEMPGNDSYKSVVAGVGARTVVTVCLGEGIMIWDGINGNRDKQLEGHSGGAKCLSMSRDESLLASVGLSDKTVRLWDMCQGRDDSMKESVVLDVFDSDISSVCVTPDGALLVVGTESGAILVFDVDMPAKVAPLRWTSNPRLVLKDTRLEAGQGNLLLIQLGARSFVDPNAVGRGV
mmetsp:Transcript_17115/g.28138  ORF Transcript_17115/g.28138 Transcript_17115/m.28138 type:complete len:1375 (-) Transcript_17115:189-4313(-)|eukprot:CAMPEP_0184644540 /NCGR_PEP_ID=MMETSP0308-20130426/1249_1 /TAXON_ID=38269 /ORGANISM="Gloeochaete witrockiana, Strain SAG 46.84" /LENGTH=1374 /DNA_ID=CAMNT_0027073135 /DNA_START=145 /DNA_END=4269 /DNA_ORIENTATION=+